MELESPLESIEETPLHTIVIILICIAVASFAIVPLIGGGFLLLSSKMCRIENVT